MPSIHEPATTPTAGADAPSAPDDYLMPPGYVATLTRDGRIVAVPVAEPAAADQAPVAPVEPTAEPGLSIAVRQYALYGSLVTLAAGGAFWMVGAGLAAAAPAMDGAVHVLKWAAVFVALVVAAVVAAKVRARTNGATTMSLFHSSSTTTKNTSIGKQVSRGRSTFTNHF
jgi:hypothetical protein